MEKITVAIPIKAVIEKDTKLLELCGDQPIKEIDRRQIEATRKEHEENKKLQYINDRRAEYPAIGDQLDAIVKWLNAQTDIVLPDELKNIVDECMAVKQRHPKP